MNILLVGANGKMGNIITKLCERTDYKIIAGIDSKEDSNGFNVFCNFADLRKDIIRNIDVVLDFSLPSILDEELEFCLKNNKPLVICATGHTDEQKDKINVASTKVPIFMTANTSLGIALINKFIQEYAEKFSKYDLLIEDRHHKLKKDCPSGTALTLKTIFDNKGIESNIVSIRMGNIVGEHKMTFCGEFEQIEISHKAESRELFADGALKACKFLLGKPAEKVYSMNDIIN